MVSVSTATDHVDLAITGMTCASCANRIERTLNGLDGVSATVNYATEQASVDFDPRQASADDLVGAVASAGYQAAPPQPAGADAPQQPGPATRCASACSSRSSSRCPCSSCRWCRRCSSTTGSGCA